jgi:hypothetical protein
MLNLTQFKKIIFETGRSYPSGIVVKMTIEKENGDVASTEDVISSIDKLTKMIRDSIVVKKRDTNKEAINTQLDRITKKKEAYKKAKEEGMSSEAAYQSTRRKKPDRKNL